MATTRVVAGDGTSEGDAIVNGSGPAPDSPSGGAGLVGNASALLVGRLVVAALGWTGTVLIVRSLDAEAFGQFAFVFSLLGMMSIVSDLGMGRVAIRGVLDPERDQAEFAGTYIVLRSVLGLVAYLLAVGFVVIAQYPQVVVHATIVGGLVVLLATPSHAYHIAFQSLLRMRTVAVAGVLGQFAQLAVTVALVTIGGTVVWFVVPAVVAELVILGLLVPRAHQLMSFRYAVRPGIWREIAKEAVPLSIGGALFTLYNQVDTVMLSKLDTFASVGTYGVAYKFAELARFVATAITTPMLTMLVTSWAVDAVRFRGVVQRATALMAFLGGLLVVESVLFAEPVVVLLYGESYRPAGAVTGLLVTAIVVSFFALLAVNVLIAAEDHLVYPLVAAIGLAVNVALNAVLIPNRSFTGAALATIVTEVVVLVLLVGATSRLSGLRPIRFRFLPRAIVVVGLAATAGWGVDLVAPWPVAAVVSVTVYLVAADLTRSVGGRLLHVLLEDDHPAAARAGTRSR
jgi:O-antigen/teichoic acid export membrane protein